MGKQSKLKKIRKSGQLEDSQLPKQIDANRFVENIEKQGYSLKQVQRAPEVPTNQPKPQV